MSTGFGTRTKEIQEIVLTYFQSWGSEAEVRPKPNLPSAVDVVLRGALAHRFETVSVPDKGQPNTRLLRLLFDRTFASSAPGYELVVPRSHLLRLIRNDLATRASFTRAGILLNLEESFADLEAMGVVIRYAAPEATSRYVFRRFYAVRYMLRQSAYERFEDIVLILVDPDKGVVLSAVEAAKFAELNLVDYNRAPYRDKIFLTPPTRDYLLRVFQLAEDVAKKRAAETLSKRANELYQKLQEECHRVSRHYEAEMKDASPARCRELEKLRDQELRELQQRYQIHCELELLSLEEIVVPLVEYTLSIPRPSPAKLAQVFVFDPLTNIVNTTNCAKCKQHLSWAYCSRGKHLECAKCGAVEPCCHRDCGLGFCPAHGVRCKQCSRMICENHEVACSYCMSDRRYCADHILRSFEGRYICPECARFCGECGQAFPPKRSTKCIVCYQDFCDVHSLVCPSCGQHHCQKHGATPRFRTQVFCHHCLSRCGFCKDDLCYLKADLMHCTECGTSVCPDHLKTCVSCKSGLCPTHALSTSSGDGCAACFAYCRSCGKIAHRSHLKHCHFCPRNDQGLHCGTHLRQCDLCRAFTCDVHRYQLADGRQACPSCSVACAVCSRRFAHNQLVNCRKCRLPVCSEDSVCSQFRNEVYCLADAQNFVQCGGCDRRGPQSQLEICTLCNMPYCPHCIPNGKDTRCIYCDNLRPIRSASELGGWYQAVYSNPLSNLSASHRKEIMRALTSLDTCFSFTATETAQYYILCATWKSGIRNFFRKWFWSVKGFVLVRDKHSSQLKVRINP